MSTCLGAAVVFCHPRSKSDPNIRDVGPGTMCFSLALAGSVMVTVSVISIGPECLRRDVDGGGGGGGWIRLFSWLMVQRLVAFGMGWGLYGEFFFESFPFLLLLFKSFIIYFSKFCDFKILNPNTSLSLISLSPFGGFEK